MILKQCVHHLQTRCQIQRLQSRRALIISLLYRFDCLHDEGLIYANKLLDAGNDVEINETIGTMHGFDIVRKAKTTKVAINKRISFMKKRFEEKCS